MKKFICIAICVVMMLSLCAPAFAIDIAEGDRMRAMEAVAYLGLDDVDESMKAEIIAAREEIVFSESWVVHGHAEILDENGNVVREIPKFYDLFPADWDVPVLNTEDFVVPVQYMSMFERAATFAVLFDQSVMLNVPSATVNSTPFTYKNTYYTATDGDTYTYSRMNICGIYSNDYGNGTYNVGAKNAVTGASELLVEYVPNGYTCSYTPDSKITLAIRASTYNPNYASLWHMRITGNY